MMLERKKHISLRKNTHHQKKKKREIRAKSQKRFKYELAGSVLRKIQMQSSVEFIKTTVKQSLLFFCGQM